MKAAVACLISHTWFSSYKALRNLLVCLSVLRIYCILYLGAVKSAIWREVPWCTICCLATSRKANSSNTSFKRCSVIFLSQQLLKLENSVSFTYCFCPVCLINSGSVGRPFLFLLCDLFSLINVNQYGLLRCSVLALEKHFLSSQLIPFEMEQIHDF